jgi:hypothetical protein
VAAKRAVKGESRSARERKAKKGALSAELKRRAEVRRA